MPRCIATKPDGSPCERIVSASRKYCYAHDPSKAAARSRTATKAGRSKPHRELHETRTQLQDLVDKILAKKIDRGAAAVAGQLLNVKLRALVIERRIKESEEFEARLDEIERRLPEVSTRSSRWG